MYRSFAASLILFIGGVASAQDSVVERPFNALELEPGTSIARVLQRYPTATPDGVTRSQNGSLWRSFVLPKSTYAGYPAEYYLGFQDSHLVEVRAVLHRLPTATAKKILAGLNGRFTSRYGIPSVDDAMRIFMSHENYSWHFSGGGPDRTLRLEEWGDWPSDSQSVRITERVED
jgi:hypothetical protein